MFHRGDETFAARRRLLRVPDRSAGRRQRSLQRIDRQLYEHRSGFDPFDPLFTLADPERILFYPRLVVPQSSFHRPQRTGRCATSVDECESSIVPSLSWMRRWRQWKSACSLPARGSFSPRLLSRRSKADSSRSKIQTRAVIVDGPSSSRRHSRSAGDPSPGRVATGDRRQRSRAAAWRIAVRRDGLPGRRSR